jgi:Uma2 family endonuclease
MVMDALTRRYTRDEVVEMFDEETKWPRYEVVDGELLVTPSGSSPHQIAALELAVALHAYVKSPRLGRVWTSPSDLTIDEHTMVQPDIWVAGTGPTARVTKRGWESQRPVIFTIEIISPSSRRADREPKRRLYQRIGVPDYWIVDVDARAIERWTPTATEPDICRDRITWHPTGASAPFTLDIATLMRECESSD